MRAYEVEHAPACSTCPSWTASIPRRWAALFTFAGFPERQGGNGAGSVSSQCTPVQCPLGIHSREVVRFLFPGVAHPGDEHSPGRALSFNAALNAGSVSAERPGARSEAEARGHVPSSSDRARLHGAKSRSLRTSQGNGRSSFNFLRHGRCAASGIVALHEDLRLLRIPSPGGSAAGAHSAALLRTQGLPGSYSASIT